MKIIRGGITAPHGFEASGISCGIKKGNALDLALIYSQQPALAVGLFTSSHFPANHVVLDRTRLNRYGRAQAIIVNSGNANCAVGEKGLSDAERVTDKVAKVLGINSFLVLMASTGIIGKRLPVEKIERAIPLLINTKRKDRYRLASRAIMTTDKKPKDIALELKIKGKKIRIGAMAKGAGMINPRLATMLCFITTDLSINSKLLKKALKEAVDNSFNRISIDGEMSTNDSVIIMANGLAGNRRIDNLEESDFLVFSEGLRFGCEYLARQIVLDGEGATKFISIKVKGAKNRFEAERVSRTIANSPLFKTAMYGQNPNWGRIISACGASEARLNPEKLDISLGGQFVFRCGKPVGKDFQHFKKILEKREIKVEIDLNLGKGEYSLWTIDLSEDYVRINAGYE
ncbi:MAG: bifunctional glutamate N-acetyltransferase/amino-acid acetyltransferase ArgJ [Candidatus Omnitrophica bacterium]|nr:bifunctional glutamate N-acetyltransferase/amino-acid acetyltransferase ArgJ [Candidatus Omnitrophota bacterium]